MTDNDESCCPHLPITNIILPYATVNTALISPSPELPPSGADLEVNGRSLEHLDDLALRHKVVLLHHWLEEVLSGAEVGEAHRPILKCQLVAAERRASTQRQQHTTHQLVGLILYLQIKIFTCICCWNSFESGVLSLYDHSNDLSTDCSLNPI